MGKIFDVDEMVITSDYGFRTLGGKREFHNGVDVRSWNLIKYFRLPILLPCEAVFNRLSWEDDWGYTAVFDTPKLADIDQIRFTHIAKPKTKFVMGETYPEGTKVSVSALTDYMQKKGFGEHLHFSVWQRREGEELKHTDPKIYFGWEGLRWRIK